MDEDGGLREGFLKLVESNLVLQAPNELRIFPGETSQGNCCVRKADNEASIEVGKAEERLYLLDVCWDRQFGDGLHFCAIHSDTCGRYHESQELNRVSMEQGFLWFDVEVVFSEAG